MSQPVFTDPDLLIPPLQRAAYSDRTALLMAELSLLAYTKFEEPTGKSELESDLARGGFALVNTYKIRDTEAFLAIQDLPKPQATLPGMIVLSFRGTEKTKGDILTDLKTGAIEVDGVRMHEGFHLAFELIKDDIWEDLKPKLDLGYTLYLTGHSLGGALALFATREIGNDSTGACYTFGSPRVAGLGFDKAIKTPIYRVVNSSDRVPTLPPEVIPRLLHWVLGLFGMDDQSWLRRNLAKVTGYVHHGDQRYMTAGTLKADGSFSGISLLSNPSRLYRFMEYIKGFRIDKKAALKNHSLVTYCAKLRSYAKSRN